MKRNVVVLGFVSFFADVASDMVLPLLPAFLLTIGGGAASLGAIEGAADAVQSFFKYASGRSADRVRRLLPLAALGYGIAAAVRPVLALTRAPWQVLALRCTDRVGKGIRSSPRDKLLAGSVPKERLAEAFAFHRGMDHAGAAVGPLLASGLLLMFPGGFRRIFLIASVPGALAVLTLLLVREEVSDPRDRSPTSPTHARGGDSGARGAAGSARADVSDPRARSPTSPTHARGGATVPRTLLAAIGLFSLGNSTDALLLLRAAQAGVPTVQLPLLWAMLHVVRSALSWPLGRVADRLGRRAALGAGFLWYALCYAAFARVSSPGGAWLVFAAYGAVAGLTEGSERALVTAAVPPASRGSALGLYSLISGAGLLGASVLAGQLWERVSPRAALDTGAAFALAASLMLAAVPARQAPET